jgi:hypothetical protein
VLSRQIYNSKPLTMGSNEPLAGIIQKKTKHEKQTDFNVDFLANSDLCTKWRFVQD